MSFAIFVDCIGNRTQPWYASVVDSAPQHHQCSQVASKRVANAKSDKFHKNIHRRGAVPESTQVRGTGVASPCNPSNSPLAQKEKSSITVGPIMLGFFIFVVVGSGA